jgi:penicillin amidase
VAAATSTWAGRTWGELHELTPLHPLRRQLGDAVRPTSGPVSGAAGCVMATNHIPGLTFGAVTGSTARYVWDLANPARSGWVVPLGASGDPASPHYGDQTEAYVAGHLYPVEAEPERSLDLLPPA